MAIAQQHAAIQAEIARFARRHSLNLGGEHVVFFDVIALLEEFEQQRLDRLFLFALQRTAAQDDIQILATDHLGGLLAHLVGRQVDQQIRDAHNRVVFILAHHDIDQRAVLLGHHAVQRHGAGDPLILFDAAVIVRIGIGDIVSLVEGVLLDIDARRIDVRAHDIDALFQRLLAQVEQHHGLAHAIDIYLVAGFKGALLRDGLLQINIASLLRGGDRFGHAFALGFAVIQKIAVTNADSFQHSQRFIVIILPGIGTFHKLLPPNFYQDPYILYHAAQRKTSNVLPYTGQVQAVRPAFCRA